MSWALGIDIGGTNTKIGIVAFDGKLVCADFIKTNSEDSFDTFANRVYQKSKEILKANEVNLLGVGVGAPNANSSTGCIEHPPNLKWDVVNVVDKLSKLFNLPVRLENDANVAAYGERKWGKGKNIDDLIVVTLGTGLGTGIFSSGRLITSYNGMAAEGGHISIYREGRLCGCGGRGHLESYVSVRGIKQNVFEFLQKELSFAEICELYEKQDANIIKAVDKTADDLAYGLTQMHTLFLPRKIILAGGVSNLGDRFCDQVRKQFSVYVYSAFKDQCSIEISDISLKHGAILGAASLLF